MFATELTNHPYGSYPLSQKRSPHPYSPSKKESSTDIGVSAALSALMFSIKTTHCSYVTADKRMQLKSLGAAEEEIQAIGKQRFRLLGGMISSEDGDSFDINSMPEPVKALSIPRSVIKIGRELGKGGFGTVYEGEWSFMKVAVKCYEGSKLPECVAQEVRHEVGIMSRLNHECIVRLFGLVEEDHHPVMLVMEYVANGSLYDYLHTPKELPWRHRLRIAEELSRGLAYLHSQNIIHCDIKSPNVVLDKSYCAKWCDFGLAKLKLHSLTTSKADGTDSLVGTPNWMAPELFSRKSSTPTRASDIWALGMVFFELASREVPYKEGLNQGQIITWITSGEGEEVPPECIEKTPSFAALMQRCWLVKDQRPTAEQIAAEVAVIMENFQEMKETSPAKPSAKGSPNKQVKADPLSYVYNAFSPPEEPKGPSPQVKAPIQAPLQVKEVSFTPQLPEIAFGKAKWAHYFGDIGVEPPLPSDIHTLLNTPCPFFSGKKIGESHMLVLIPKRVNGKTLTIASLGELVKNPRNGNATQWRNFDDGGYANLSTDRSHWVLMTKDVVDGTRDKSYKDQLVLVTGKENRMGIRYEAPHLMDAAVCLFMHYVSTGQELFSDKPWTYTRCQEKYRDEDWQMVTGGFAGGGLVLNYLIYSDAYIGLAASFSV